MKPANRHLLWLNWPEGAFRLNARSLAVFKSLAVGEVMVAKSERAFLRSLPEATHAVVWEFRREWFARAPRLRVLATPGAGRELLPGDGEMPPGVVRVNGTFHGAIMSETVVACIFAHARGLYAAADFQRRGALWPRVEMTPFCSLVAGTKAVILGYGHVGRAIGAKLEALGVEVKGIGRRSIGELGESLRSADWLVMALPGDTGTDDIVSAAELRCMKRTAVIVNVGRGNAIEERALAAALKSRRIAGAYLDVFKKEPLAASSPLAADLPGLVRLPHASAFAPEYLPMFFREMAAAGWMK